MKLLTVKNLTIEFETLRGRLRAVDNVSFELNKSETLGIVGESGCGKSLTSLAVMGLLPPNAIVTADTLMFKDVDLLNASQTRFTLSARVFYVNDLSRPYDIS